MDVRNDTTASDGSLNQCVELFISADGELQVSGCDSLHLEILASVASQLEHLGSEVFEDGSSVHG